MASSLGIKLRPHWWVEGKCSQNSSNLALQNLSLSPSLFMLSLSVPNRWMRLFSFLLGRLRDDKHGSSGRLFNIVSVSKLAFLLSYLLLLLVSKYSLDYTSSFRVSDAKKSWIHVVYRVDSRSRLPVTVVVIGAVRSFKSPSEIKKVLKTHRKPQVPENLTMLFCPNEFFYSIE